MPKRKPIPPGTRFARLVVIEESPAASAGYHSKKVLCMCDCGKLRIVLENNLRNGQTRSCGCLRIEEAKARFTIHGGCRTPLYQIWIAMRARCSDPEDAHYHLYGGRGIHVCERWNNSFDNFRADVGKRPPKTSLGRIDNNKGYSPDNCRWETQKQQMRNMSRNRILTVMGITAPLAALCEHFQIDRGVVKTRLKLGWPADLAFTKPVKKRP